MHADNHISSSSHSGSWKCIFPTPDVASDKSNTDASTLITQIHNFPITLKDDKRSLVKRGDLFGKDVVAKQPRDKNRRSWMRLLSLFRMSEALSSQQTLANFSQQGIESVKPICVLEQRKYGFLIDSWLIYEFREGQVSNLKQLPEIITLLQKLHMNDYRHDDPNFGNFLIDPNGDLFLIDCKGKKRLGYFSDYYDFMLLSQRNEGIAMKTLIDVADIKTHSWAYKLAEFYSTYKRKRTELKAKRRKK